MLALVYFVYGFSYETVFMSSPHCDGMQIASLNEKHTYCGDASNVPQRLIIRAQRVNVTFMSNYVYTGRGFKIMYRIYLKEGEQFYVYSAGYRKYFLSYIDHRYCRERRKPRHILPSN